MLTPQELRIGNMFYFECDKLHMTTLGVIESISTSGIYTGGDRVGEPIYTIGLLDQWGQKRQEHIIDLDGIPLTPDMLDKCGFKKPNHCWDDYRLNLGFGQLYFLPSTSEVYHSVEIDDLPYTVNSSTVNQLHQLQNYYFALTGEELQYNPEG